MRAPKSSAEFLRSHSAADRARSAWVLGWICVLWSLSPALQAQGNSTRGEALYEARCGGCHSPDVNRVGPKHRGVLGRTAGTVPDYSYSSAVKKSGIVWTAQTLDRWLANPEGLVPGQKMGYAVTDPADRADIIEYLARLSVP